MQSNWNIEKGILKKAPSKSNDSSQFSITMQSNWKQRLKNVEHKAMTIWFQVITPWVRHIVTINSSPGVDGTGIQVKFQ